MKLKFNVLAGSVLASAMSLSSFAQVTPPPVPDGSNSSRAPLPTQRPYEYVVETPAQPAQSTISATHIGGPDAVAVNAPSTPVTSTQAQIFAPPTPDGSNASRAPLPTNRPYEYVNVTPDAAQPAQSAIVATHIGGPEIAATGASATVVEPILTPTGRVTVGASASLDAAMVSSQIRSDATASQNQLGVIETRITATDASLAATRDALPAMSEANRAEFKSANDDVKAKEKTLRQSIKTARNSNAEQVAADYEAYAAAVARADGIAAQR